MGTKLVTFTSRKMLCKTSTRPSTSLLVLLTIFPPTLNQHQMLQQLPKGRNLNIQLAMTPPPSQGGLHLAHTLAIVKFSLDDRLPKREHKVPGPSPEGPHDPTNHPCSNKFSFKKLARNTSKFLKFINVRFVYSIFFCEYVLVNIRPLNGADGEVKRVQEGAIGEQNCYF